MPFPLCPDGAEGFAFPPYSALLCAVSFPSLVLSPHRSMRWNRGALLTRDLRLFFALCRVRFKRFRSPAAPLPPSGRFFHDSPHESVRHDLDPSPSSLLGFLILLDRLCELLLTLTPPPLDYAETFLRIQSRLFPLPDFRSEWKPPLTYRLTYSPGAESTPEIKFSAASSSKEIEIPTV